MILCDHNSWLKLRQRYINTLQARLQRININASLLNTFCSAISDWFDHGVVNPHKYLEQYHQAILQQTGIGWRHIYTGHITTAGSALQIPDGQTTDTSKARYMWAASIVEVSLEWMVDLWEARNKDVHGHAETEQNSKLKGKHQDAHRLSSLRWRFSS